MNTPISYKQAFIFLLVIGLTSILFLALRPLPKATEDNCEKVVGQVVQIAEGGTHDIVFKLKNDHDTYYINRGLESGLTLNEVNSLEGKQVTLYYVQHWTPFNAIHEVRHLAKVEASGRIIYNEIEE